MKMKRNMKNRNLNNAAAVILAMVLSNELVKDLPDKDLNCPAFISYNEFAKVCNKYIKD